MTRHRIRRAAPLLVTLITLVALAAFYVLGTAWLQARLYPHYDLPPLLRARLIDLIVAAWLVYFCSCIGSFLNVVAWRMPRGEGIGGRSHCPRCGSTLKSRDNFPVLGWIALRGRCRVCRLPISRRYPTVEALVGVSLTVVGITQLYSLALPGQALHGHGGPLWAPHVTPRLIAILSYHVVALTGLWAMTLIRIDGVAVPRRLLGTVAAVATIPPLIYPPLMVVPWQAQRPPAWDPDGLHFDAIMRVTTALVTAAFYARVLAKGLCPTADLKLDPLGSDTRRLVDLVAMLGVPAVLIGWQSMPGFVLVAAIGSFVLAPLLERIPINEAPDKTLRRRGAMERFAFALPWTLVLHLAGWRLLWQVPWWPSDNSHKGVLLAAGLGSLLVPLLLNDKRTDAGSGRTAADGWADPEASGNSGDELPEDRGEGESDH